MEPISIQRLTSEPGDIYQYPDYLFNLLIQRGSGLLEAEVVTWTDAIDWRFSRDGRGMAEAAWSCHRHKFRPLLAALAFRVGISPYAGYTSFQVQFADEAQAHPGFFTLYLSNGNTGFWARLYLRGADTRPEQRAA